jgi:hypothetical protein
MDIIFALLLMKSISFGSQPSSVRRIWAPGGPDSEGRLPVTESWPSAPIWMKLLSPMGGLGLLLCLGHKSLTSYTLQIGTATGRAPAGRIVVWTGRKHPFFNLNPVWISPSHSLSFANKKLRRVKFLFSSMLLFQIWIYISLSVENLWIIYNNGCSSISGTFLSLFLFCTVFADFGRDFFRSNIWSGLIDFHQLFIVLWFYDGHRLCFF